MKKKVSNIIWTLVVILLIVGTVGFYLYDVIWVKTPYTKNLFRTIAIIFLLLATLLRLINGSGRNSLEMYEKAYANELGYAFKNKPF